MTANEIVSLLSTQGLALVLVLGGALWTVRILVPKYLEGIRSEVKQAATEAKEGLDQQTERIDVQTSAIEVLTALMLSTVKTTMTAQEFEDLLTRVRLLRQRANGGSHK